MIRWTLRRAGRLTCSSRIVTVVAAQHRALWNAALPAEALASVVVQPENRGTGTGVLLPLLHVLRRNRDARIAVLPADHAVEDEDVLTRALERAFDLVERGVPVILLGMTPELPDPSYGWIVSGNADAGGSRPVLSFHEKPDAPFARELYLGGAHWSTFILVARARALLSIYEYVAPFLIRSLVRAFVPAVWKRGNGWDPDTLKSVYAGLPHLDLSRDLLQRVPTGLRMLPVPPCGWTDLGTPDRIERWMRSRRANLLEAAVPVA